MAWKRNGLSKWIWKCPHVLTNNKKCPGRGKKPMSKYQAGRYGRYHLKKVHGDYISEPDLVKI